MNQDRQPRGSASQREYFSLNEGQAENTHGERTGIDPSHVGNEDSLSDSASLPLFIDPAKLRLRPFHDDSPLTENPHKRRLSGDVQEGSDNDKNPAPLKQRVTTWMNTLPPPRSSLKKVRNDPIKASDPERVMLNPSASYPNTRAPELPNRTRDSSQDEIMKDPGHETDHDDMLAGRAGDNTFSHRLGPEVLLAARIAIDALRGIVQHDEDIKKIEGAFKSTMVEVLAKARFQIKTFAWLSGTARDHGFDMESFSSANISFQAALVQQKRMLESVAYGTASETPQQVHDLPKTQRLTIIAKHCQLLYSWVTEWQQEQAYLLAKPIAVSAATSTTNHQSEPVVVEARGRTAGTGTMSRRAEKGGHKETRGQSKNHTAPTDMPGIIAAGQSAFEARHLPLRIEGRPDFGRKDIFHGHPSSKQNLVNDSMPVETVLEAFPNHINAIGCRIMNDSMWTSQHIAEILLELGHPSIFSILPDNIHRKWLTNWIRRRRGCGTQKKRQAENKIGKAKQKGDNINDTEEDESSESEASVQADQADTNQTSAAENSAIQFKASETGHNSSSVNSEPVQDSRNIFLDGSFSHERVLKTLREAVSEDGMDIEY